MNDSRVIMVDGKNSGWYEKAIFILTEEGRRSGVSNDMVTEAEKIVETYLKQQLRGETYNKDYKIKDKQTVQKPKGKATASGSFMWLKVLTVMSILICGLSILSFIL